MNARQAAKAAAARIEVMEQYNAKAKADIVAYNQCVVSVIEGRLSFCDWCEDKEECQREVKGTGCSEWWLSYNPPVKAEEGEPNESERLLQGCSPSGERA